MTRPRIRSIKPEIWHSRDFQALSCIGRLTFIALFSNADDEGRLKSDPGHLATNYLTGCPSDEIAAQLQVMEDRGMAVTYRVRGEWFIALRNHCKHQKVDRPSPSELPPPPKFKRNNNSNNGQIEFEPLASAREPVRRIGEDRIGEDRTPDGESVVTEVLGAWRDGVGADRDITMASASGRKRRRLVASALRERLVVDVRDALLGWRWDAWERRVENNDVEDCLRPGNIERFRDWERGLRRPQIHVTNSVDERVRGLVALPLPALAQ